MGQSSNSAKSLTEEPINSLVLEVGLVPLSVTFLFMLAIENVCIYMFWSQSILLPGKPQPNTVVCHPQAYSLFQN